MDFLQSLRKGSLLLHVCCAPCSGPIIETILNEGFLPTIFFYNPNVHPKEEYEFRKASVVAYAKKKRILMVDADYDDKNWFDCIKGLENEPERGRRCSICFDIRLNRTAQYAHENGFKRFATTNSIARWKNLEQVNRSGIMAASRYPNITFMAVNWRKNGADKRISIIAKREGFYKQEYCGCVFSLQARNEQRKIV